MGQVNAGTEVAVHLACFQPAAPGPLASSNTSPKEYTSDAAVGRCPAITSGACIQGSGHGTAGTQEPCACYAQTLQHPGQGKPGSQHGESAQHRVLRSRCMLAAAHQPDGVVSDAALRCGVDVMVQDLAAGRGAGWGGVGEQVCARSQVMVGDCTRGLCMRWSPQMARNRAMVTAQRCRPCPALT